MALHHRLIILGSGPAGYTAAIYAARAGLAPVIITGNEIGGQLTTTTEVENWPGEPEGVMGPDLMDRMKRHAETLDIQMINDHIYEATLSSDGYHTLQGHQQYICDALIIATGATAQYLGLESEQEFMGRGVSACATCDGFFYRKKPVIVVGGGNTAVEEALYLSGLASKVTVVHRRDTFRAEKILQDRLFAKCNDNVEILWNSKLELVLGDDTGVTGVQIRNVSDQSQTSIAVDGVFIAIGHKPNTDIFKGQLPMQDGYIDVLGTNSSHNSNNGHAGNATATDCPGVFVCGDVADSIYRQAVTSAGSGCMAALDAEKYLANK